MTKMTGPEHYEEAQRLVDVAAGYRAFEPHKAAAAQVHATLALAAAVAAAIPPDGNEPIVTAWYKAGAW